MGTKATSQSRTNGPVSAAHRPPLGGLPAALPAAGNQAIGRLLQAAAGDPGSPLDSAVRGPLERDLGVNLGGVRVHGGRNAEAAAEGVGARAYTVGSDVYLGRAAHGLGAEARHKLLTHEAVHTVQQGGERVPLTGSMPVSNTADAAEREASAIAQGSPALAMRDAMRLTSVTPHIQRDITDSKKWPQGEFKVDFAEVVATHPGDDAGEEGTITFTPSDTAPESDHINFIQVIREFDTTTGKEYDRPGDLRNQAQTTQDTKKNVAGGFFVDFDVDTAKPRTGKSDPAVSAVYPHMNQEGFRRGKAKKDAVLGDKPHFNQPLKYNFITVARATDKGDNLGVVYGTVLWGFEIIHDDKKVAKVKSEYVNFRVTQGETFDAALQKFNEVFKNPGTAGAPK